MKKLAYIYKESVVVCDNEEMARKILGCPPSKQLIVEPAKAYNTPTGDLGIVIATGSKELRTDKKANMAYWDEIDEIVNKHITACIKELKNWSVTDIEIGEDIISDISKNMEEKLISNLEHWGGADFPYVDEEA